MINKILLSILILNTANSFAQVTLGTNDFVSGSAMFNVAHQTNAGANAALDLTQTGANHTWDFSSLTKDNTGVDTFLSVSSTPYFLEFTFGSHASNVAQRGNDINILVLQISNVFNMFKNGNSSYDFTGYGGTVSGFPIPFYCTPHDVIYKFPLAFGNLDSSDSRLTASLPGTFSYSQNRHRVNTVDGWGTLTIPGGSFQCLRLKSEIFDVDTVVIDTALIPPPFGPVTLPINLHNFEYKWLVAGKGEPMLQINKSGLGAVSSVTFRDLPTGISSPEIFPNEINIYPNPADVFCSVISTNEFQKAELNLLDVSGRILKTENVTGTNMAILSTKNLPNGIYFLQIKNNKEVTDKKIVVQH